MIRNPLLSIIHMMLSSGQCERGTIRIRCAWDAGSSACLTRRNSAAMDPYGYDVKELIAREQAARRGSCAKLPEGCERN